MDEFEQALERVYEQAKNAIRSYGSISEKRTPEEFAGQRKRVGLLAKQLIEFLKEPFRN